MNKIMNFCFIIIVVLGLTQSKLLKTTTETKTDTKTKLSTCWSYATNQDHHLEGVFPLNVAYVNKKTGVRKGLVYSSDKNVCTSVCEKSRYGSSCYRTHSYDIDFKIPKDSYVCWFDRACPRHADRTLYTVRDSDISHDSKYRCGFLCDAIYGQDGRCMKRVQTDDEKKKDFKDEKYYCFYQRLATLV